MPNGANDGMLAWSIGFSDAVRSEATPSRSRSFSGTDTLRSNTSAEYDGLLGTSDAIVGVEALATEQSIPAEGKIRGTLLLRLAATTAVGPITVPSSVNNALTFLSTDPFASTSAISSPIPLGADTNRIAIIMS